jgi:geranylgeranyl diphosphate synthase type I
MVEGKTAALLACSAQMGGMIGGADETSQASYVEFGRSLGLAFQVQDDWLGIWGDTVLTGKPSESDLVSRKKSLPILYGIEEKRGFYQRWVQGDIAPEDVAGMAGILRTEGAYENCLQSAQDFTLQAVAALEHAAPPSDARQALLELSHRLLERKS